MKDERDEYKRVKFRASIIALRNAAVIVFHFRIKVSRTETSFLREITRPSTRLYEQ